MASFKACYLKLCVFLVLLATVICISVPKDGFYQTGDNGILPGNQKTKGAAFKFASYFGNHMVLQRAPRKAGVWGYASVTDLNKVVTVTVSGTKGVVQTKKVTVRSGSPMFVKKGIWTVQFDLVEASENAYTVQASLGKEKISLTDVLFGDVWICSGQSNMVFTINQAFNSSYFKKESVNYQSIRLFHVAQKISKKPEYDLLGVSLPWSRPNNKTLSGFSSVCYIYATLVYEKIGVPLGLVESAWGGTPVEAWSSPQSLKLCGIKNTSQAESVQNWRKDEVYMGMMKELQKSYPDMEMAAPPQEHSVLWNAMIHPLLPMTIYGTLWYQGEQNTNHGYDQYNCTFPGMIRDWRDKFFQTTGRQTNPKFPFGFVQIGPYRTSHSILSKYCDVRWHQTADRGSVPNSLMENTFMSVALDLTDAISPYGGVHYRDKNTTAHRVALSGLSVAYNVPGLHYQGPLPSAYHIDIGYDTLNIEYDQAKTELYVKNATAANGYEVCCSHDNRSSCPMDTGNWTVSPILSSDSHSVTVSFKHCAGMWIMGWRYIWRETPCEYKSCPLYTVENNLPAAPFFVRGLLGSKEAWKLKREMWEREDGREWLKKMLEQRKHLRISGHRI